MRETIIEALMTENKNLKACVTKLGAGNYALQQCGHQNNIEINGIVNSVANADIEQKVIEIFKSIDIEVKPNDIEAAHRLPSKSDNKPVIVRFVNRKFCERASMNKKTF